MELRSVPSRPNAWHQNAGCSDPPSKTRYVGNNPYTSSHNMEQQLPNGLPNDNRWQRADMSVDHTHKKIIDNSMSAYSEKMRRISLERDFVSSTAAQRYPPRSDLNYKKVDRQISSEIITSSAGLRHYDITRSSSELMRQPNDTRHFRGTNTSDSFTEDAQNGDIDKQRLSHFRNRRIGVITKEQTKREDIPKSRTGTESAKNVSNSTHAVPDIVCNDCDTTVSESIVEISPFPPYKESTFYKKRMKSSRLRFSQSEYTDRTEQIANRIRPRFMSTGRFGPVRFSKIPLWKQRALEARKERLRRAVPPKPPPKTYHHIFRYSDAVKELYSSYDSNCDVENGASRHTNPIVTFSDAKDDLSVSQTSESPKSVSWSSEGSVTRPRQNLRNSLDVREKHLSKDAMDVREKHSKSAMDIKERHHSKESIDIRERHRSKDALDLKERLQSKESMDIKEKHHSKNGLDARMRHHVMDSLDVRNGHNFKDNSDAKSVQFQLPKVVNTAGSRSLESSFQRNSNHKKVNIVNVNH